MNVKIVSDGPCGFGTKVMTQDGVEVGGLTAITFRAEADNINRAELELYVAEIAVEGVAAFYARGKEVRRIEYADGTVDEFPAS